MDCGREERVLPQYVKDAGSSPLLHYNAWKESWRALEDLYSHPKDATDESDSENESYYRLLKALGFPTMNWRI